MKGDDWRQQAVCAQIGDGPWYPAKGESARPAKWICKRRCPVREQCLEAALTEEAGAGIDSRYGIRGGLTGPARWRLQQRRDQGAAA